MSSTPTKVLAVAVAMSALALGLWGGSKSWRVTSIDAIAMSSAGDARRIRFALSGTAFEATVIRSSRDRVVARLVNVEAGQTLDDVAGDATLAINGGYFDAAFSPFGLYRIGSREVSPWLARPPLSGVVTIDAAGRLDVGTRDEPAAPSAFQAGPFVIDPGGAIGIRGDDGKLAERTLIACDERSIVAIVTTPTTLRAIAECLHDRPEAFGLDRVDRALNLDGGPSAGFVLRGADGIVRSPPRGRIRSAIVFVGREADGPTSNGNRAEPAPR